MCLGRRKQGGTDPAVPGLGLEPGRGQRWKHVAIGWSWRCVGVAVPEHRVGGCGSLLQQGRWAQAELGMISWWHLLAF